MLFLHARDVQMFALLSIKKSYYKFYPGIVFHTSSKSKLLFCRMPLIVLDGDCMQSVYYADSMTDKFNIVGYDFMKSFAKDQQQ